MDKYTWLTRLLDALKDMPQPESEAAYRFAEEYFEEAGTERAIEELGSPEEYAQLARLEYLSRPVEHEIPALPPALKKAAERRRARREKQTASPSFLEIEVEAGELVLLRGERFEADLSRIANPNLYDIHQEETDEGASFSLHGLGHFGPQAPRVQICVPDSVRDLSLRLPMGSLKVYDLSLDSLNAVLRMGSAEFSNVEIGHGRLDLSMGSLDLAARNIGEIQADCRMGSVVLRIPGSPADYDFDVRSRLGSIQIGHEQRIDGMKSSYKRHNGACRFIDLDCRMGSIEVKFTRPL